MGQGVVERSRTKQNQTGEVIQMDLLVSGKSQVHVTTWMNLNSILSERSQAPEGICMSPFIGTGATRP